MSHDPVKLKVLEDELLERGFTRLEVGRMLAAADPVAIVLSKQDLQQLDQQTALAYRWNVLPGPPARSDMQICTLAERDLLDRIHAKRREYPPFMRECLGEFPR